MFTPPRPYRDERDLERMRALLVKGRAAANGSYYVHLGDLNWWLYYLNDPADRRRHIHLWEQDSQLLGWSLLSPRWNAFDAYVHPSIRGSAQAAQVYQWAEERLAGLAAPEGGELRTMWIREGDAVLEAHLRGRGFWRNPEPLLYLERSLLAPLPRQRLPAGFEIATTSDRRDLALRAAASHETFGSRQSFDRYLWRYERFRRSPVYDPQLNLAIVAPDGRVAAFCTCWVDPHNRVGLFEPVGTHPEFRRLGLGKAVVLAGLERLRAAGMRSAAVVSESGQPAAQRLYSSAGFQPALRLFTYSKPLLAAGEIHPALAGSWTEWT